MKKIKKIAVTGGKGGVGKSTVAVFLSNELSRKEKIILVDADIECPNDYLLVGKKLTKPVRKITAKFPVLDEKKCLSCGLCAQKCRFKAIFAPKGEKPKFFHDLCANCGLCWNICPSKAIKVEEKQTGEIFETKIKKNLILISGRTIGVVDETGPVVRELKDYALKRAKELEVSMVIFDTAPGIHCNVVQALLGVDYAYVVTEPTVLGEHDLGIMLDLLSEIKVSGSVVINQSDLGDKKGVLKVAREKGFLVSNQIKYSRKIAQAYSEGDLLSLKGNYFEND